VETTLGTQNDAKSMRKCFTNHRPDGALAGVIARFNVSNKKIRRAKCTGDTHFKGDDHLDLARASPRYKQERMQLRTPCSDTVVAEVQGLYGAYVFPEKLLQKIWLRGEFERLGARTAEGMALQLIHPGRWNRLGGPDFLGARLRFDGGLEVAGDIEVHLRMKDWDLHAHAGDRAYDRVMLHVVLFPPVAGEVTRGSGGRIIPVLSLLPILLRSLEEYAAEEAVERLANRPMGRIVGELGGMAAIEVDRLLEENAWRRWKEKVHFAQLRLLRLGWDSACHHAALEILGYRVNRGPMLRIAGRWPLADWVAGAVGADVAFSAEAGNWSLHGSRPANHPRLRLQQYSDWIKARPDWPSLWRAICSDFARINPAEKNTRESRRNHRMADLRRKVVQGVCAGLIEGTRLDNLVCDGLLPLLSTEGERELFGTWRHWYAGDLPPFLAAGLRQLVSQDGGRRVICHGELQGLLGWFLSSEGKADFESS